MRLTDWTVRYAPDEEPQPVRVPHAWRHEMPVSWEGPAIYETRLEAPKTAAWLVFSGVSYEARVFLNDQLACEHRGIWDAFSVPLRGLEGKPVSVRVEVIKNGGQTFPVREVASGFLPYVFHTFGGIYQPVDLVESRPDPLASPAPAPPTRILVDGSRIYVDGEPFVMRGVLTWGWYPELGHTAPPEDTFRHEVRQAKSLGFNLVKFCLWVPPHHAFEILKEEGMEAWLELPLWDPTSDPVRQEEIAREIERIVRQFRRHDNIICWTVGCELSGSTGPEYRRYLTQMVRNLTGCPLVKDNSGGAEMYGGDLREFGDFYDFHPYCDTHFYPPVLDSLLPGPRREMPVLLGEFNDIDVHRDIASLHDEMPFWASALPELNEVGVRWQHDLPTFIRTSRFALEPGPNRHAKLMESSRQKALWIRKFVHEAVRSRDAIAGTVVTGWRDTPISTAGVVDDWGRLRYTPEETAPWNGPTVLFAIPTRRPPWVHGGNRPGYLDPLAQFTGQVFLRIGVHSEFDLRSGLAWEIHAADGSVAARGACEATVVPALESREVGEIHWECDRPGAYTLIVEFGGAANQWELMVVDRPDWKALEGWNVHDPSEYLEGLELGAGGDAWIGTRAAGMPSADRSILFLTDEGTVARPFWRESAYEFDDEKFWEGVGLNGGWNRWFGIAPDRAIDPAWLAANGFGETEVLMTRIDVRTYEELPMLVRQGSRIVTTLRPWGGLGAQPGGIKRNPIGAAFLGALLKSV